MKILIIEDDADITSMISLTLKMRWPELEMLQAMNGNNGIKLAREYQPDMIILDLGLPDIDGFDVLKSIKSFLNIPILIITVRNDDQYVITGLELGADDYMTKPFNQLVLLARVNALIRRHQLPNGQASISYKYLKLVHDLSKVYIRDKELYLTHTEGMILFNLIQNAEKVVTVASLAHNIWGVDDLSVRNSIRIYIHRLRKKIEKGSLCPQMIYNRPGIGYILKLN
jgi:two-component system KDP operon response regulator KdpE